MARPARAVELNSKHFTKAEKEARKAAENKLKVEGDILPPERLTDTQKAIFSGIVGQMGNADVLSVLDTDILAHHAVICDHLNKLVEAVNADESLILDRGYISARAEYMKEFFRTSTELCLTPQSRAKMAGMNANAEDETLTAIKAVLSNGCQ